MLVSYSLSYLVWFFHELLIRSCILHHPIYPVTTRDGQKNLIFDGMRKALGKKNSAHAMSTFVGLDIHAESTYATVIGEDGKILKQRR